VVWLVANRSATVGQEVIQTVNARELHGFLGSNKQFSNWITERIKKYGFTENVDFVIANLKSLANQTLKEYHVSIDMAKELSMVERNDQGRQARQYFIECEKKLKAVAPSALPSFPEALRLLADQVEQNAKQALQIAQQAVQIEAAAPVCNSVCDGFRVCYRHCG
jgi:phage anti-repressor protein